MSRAAATLRPCQTPVPSASKAISQSFCLQSVPWAREGVCTWLLRCRMADLAPEVDEALERALNDIAERMRQDPIPVGTWRPPPFEGMTERAWCVVTPPSGTEISARDLIRQARTIAPRVAPRAAVSSNSKQSATASSKNTVPAGGGKRADAQACAVRRWQVRAGCGQCHHAARHSTASVRR